ncbi:YcfL family protein [Actinobacillus suis]|uniref:Lipoprotein n=2 Tax=Actinobacillus suis TaxID=716 RepID=K0G5M6_ACTSU|nr:YcfL family protein [Actinobacillus suis]AFU19438.1 lipoprotein [Actinobacillus suis H91-0380]AIJ31576.1 periplasmic lipoprotein [Actinobacillus suis ATCC 33415]MCO4166453.1 YcfL family protein [Actinobacillus suis]MCO4168666.1 YcfL family protein [Actinobacillus suis]MCQ9630406.1 YcfL family protein [Actinobacillus suis]
MKHLKSYWLFAIFSFFLTACGSNPQSYIKGKSEPIVNIEAQIATLVKVEAKSEMLSVTNLSEHPLNLSYKLFWYDKQGVTQNSDNVSPQPWQPLWLDSKQSQTLQLEKPTNESNNYRVYLRGSR